MTDQKPTVKWLVERKPTGSVGNWQVVAHPSNHRQGLAAIVYLQEEEKDKRYKGRFRLVRVEREILHDTGEK